MTSTIEDRPGLALAAPRRARVRQLPDATPTESTRRTPPAVTHTTSGLRHGLDLVPAPAIQRGLPRRAQLVLGMVVEVAAGRRPPAQLNGLVTQRVLRYVAAEASRPTRHDRAPSRQTRVVVPGSGPGLRLARICHPVDDVAEITALWRHRNRVRALAARFELVAATSNGGNVEPQWRCTVLRIG